VLYRPEAFEPLTTDTWGERHVRDAIRDIVAETDSALRGPTLLWQADPWDRWHATSPMKNLYVGAAGVLWALDELRRRGLAETKLDLSALALRVLELFRARPDFQKGMKLPEPRKSAFLVGETGVLLVAMRLAPSNDLATDLEARIRANLDNEADDVMWGIPGTLVAARAMLDSTGDERWLAIGREGADALWARRDGDGFWTQHLHGRSFRGLGPPHGLVGNVHALLPLLDRERRSRLERETNALLEHTAVIEDGLANWPYHERPELASPDGQIRLQWCAGGPGVVIGAAGYLDRELLLAGAETAWGAGPPGMEKGPCICHGTAGNGYAFLKVFERTGDERWLERARRFATHALGQVRRERAARGRGRHSLWTGDVGVALFAGGCLEGRAAYPLLDG
jgi:Lanthionine synthetase C-like protein